MHTPSLDRWTAQRILVPPQPGADQEAPEPISVILLQRVRLFHGLGLGELASVAQAGERHEIPGGSYFFAQGHGDTVYLLQAGCVTITQVSPRGAVRFLRLVRPGELFGAMGQLRDQFRPTSAQALCRCRALSWNREAIGKLMRNYPVLALNALSELEDQLCEFQCRDQAAPSHARAAEYPRMVTRGHSRG